LVKKELKLKRTIRIEEEVSEQDIIATNQVQDTKQDIGLVESGKIWKSQKFYLSLLIIYKIKNGR
jgi:hypothetical protein